MRLDRLSRAASLVAACAVLAACGDGTAPKLSPVTVDTLLAELGETQALGTPGLIFAGPTALGALPTSASACPYNSSNQRFVCAPLIMGGLTTNRYYQLLDAQGAPQGEFNRASTEAFRTVADVEGSIDIDIPTDGFTLASAITLTVASHEDQTLSGLLSGTHTLNGSGNSTLTFVGGGLPGGFTSSWTTSDLVLRKRGIRSKYPQSGSIAVNTSFDGDVTSIVTMTFNGTSIMTMTIESGGITTTCTVNLANPEAFPSCN